MESIHLIITYTISIVRFGFYKDNKKYIALLKILVSRVSILKRLTWLLVLAVLKPHDNACT